MRTYARARRTVHTYIDPKVNLILYSVYLETSADNSALCKWSSGRENGANARPRTFTDYRNR